MPTRRSSDPKAGDLARQNRHFCFSFTRDHQSLIGSRLTDQVAWASIRVKRLIHPSKRYSGLNIFTFPGCNRGRGQRTFHRPSSAGQTLLSAWLHLQYTFHATAARHRALDFHEETGLQRTH